MSEALLDLVVKGDPSIFSPISTQLSAGDKKTLLAIMAGLRALGKPYTYLEIGSYLGGSLQPFLVDPLCAHIYSIDNRPLEQPKDERKKFKWTPVTTQDMLDKLRPLYADGLSKLQTFDVDSRSADPKAIKIAPTLCFIDGEHTDDASYSDFRFCLSAAAPDAIFLFHDIQIVYRGIQQCLEHLDQQRQPYRFYLLPGKMCIIETGSLTIANQPAMMARLTEAGSEIMETFQRLGKYRDWYMNNRAAKLARGMSQIVNSVLRRG